MTILPRVYDVIKGEFLLSILLFIFIFILLIPLVFLDYVQGNEEGAVFFIFLISFTITYLFYNNVNESNKVNFIEKLLLKILAIKKVNSEDIVPSVIKCEHCKCDNKIPTNLISQKGYFSILDIEFSYIFTQYFCKNCRKNSFLQIKKLSD